jgi:hypothetical protein
MPVETTVTSEQPASEPAAARTSTKPLKSK